MIRGFYIGLHAVLAIILYATLEKPEIYRLQTITVSYATTGAHFADRLDARAKRLAADLPRRAGPHTTLKRVSRHQNELHFSFEVDRRSHPFRDLGFYQRAKEKMKAELCFDPMSLKDILDDVEYVYLFLTRKNVELAKVRISKRDCLSDRRLG